MSEPGVLPGEQRVWLVELFQHAIVQHRNLVEVDDRLELMGYGNDGMLGELLPDDALDEGVGCVVDAVRGKRYVSNVLMRVE